MTKDSKTSKVTTGLSFSDLPEQVQAAYSADTQRRLKSFEKLELKKGTRYRVRFRNGTTELWHNANGYWENM